MRLKSDRHARGFTLIETIITLTVTAVLATMVFTYFGKAFTESVKPITQLKSSAALQNVMENITADSNVYPKWRSGTAYAVGNLVTPTNFNGFYYQCTVAGTSGTSEPTNWPLRSGATVTDNAVTWTWSGYLRTLPPPLTLPLPLRSLTTLKTSIGAEDTDQDNAYGKYHVVRNRFTQFVNDIDQDSDASSANKILKVTLRNDSEETQTALFVSD